MGKRQKPHILSKHGCPHQRNQIWRRSQMLPYLETGPWTWRKLTKTNSFDKGQPAGTVHVDLGRYFCRC